MNASKLNQSVHDKQNFDHNSITFNIFEQKNEKITKPKQSLVSKFLKKDKYQDNIKRDYSRYFLQIYEKQIVQEFKQNTTFNIQFLKNHEITSEHRAKMIDWIMQVILSYKMCEQTLFKSIWIFDQYLQKAKNKQTIRTMHLIGITSIFIACKYEEVQPVSVSTLTNKICGNKYSKQQIINKQASILLLINFSLQKPTLMNLIQPQIFEINKLIKSEQQSKTFKQIVIYLSRMSLFDYQISQTNPIHLAISLIYISLKTFQQYEQIQIIETEKQIERLIQKFDVQELIIKEISRKMLYLAKNYSQFYSYLKSLKRFSEFSSKKQIY